MVSTSSDKKNIRKLYEDDSNNDDNGPKGVVCTKYGDRCWYINEGTSEICEVDMRGEGVVRLEGHNIETKLTEEQRILNFQSKGIQLYYPSREFPCVKKKLCPSPGSPILLISDHIEQKIYAIDTDTWDTIILHDWSTTTDRSRSSIFNDNQNDCPMTVANLAVSYHPYPAVYASSLYRIERVSLETGEAWTLDDQNSINGINCQESYEDQSSNEGIAIPQIHGMAVAAEYLFVTEGKSDITRYTIVEENEAGMSVYNDIPGPVLFPVLPDLEGYWTDAVVVPSEPQYLLTLNDGDSSIYSFQFGTVRHVPITYDGVPSKGLTAMNWLDDFSDSLVLSNTVENRLELVHLYDINTESSFARAGRTLELPVHCPRISRKKPREKSTIVDDNTSKKFTNNVIIYIGLASLVVLLIVAVSFTWKRHRSSLHSKFNRGKSKDCVDSDDEDTGGESDEDQGCYNDKNNHTSDMT